MKTHNPKWANEEIETIWNAKMAASKDYTKAKKDRASLDVIEEKRAVFYQQTAEFKSVSDKARQNTWDQSVILLI
jgi:hypothetical protein